MNDRYRVLGRPINDPVTIVYDYGIHEDLLGAAIVALNLRDMNGYVTWVEDRSADITRSPDVTQKAFALFIQTRKNPMSERDEILVAVATEALMSKRGLEPWIR